jgi:glycosyltransferase involved in cell wall biosynthesis
LLYGDFKDDRLGASYYRAFEELGHRVLRFDTRNLTRNLSPWIVNRIGHRATIRSLGARRHGARHWNVSFINAVLQSGVPLVVVLNGDFIMPETLAAIRSRGVRVFLFHADNPFPPFYANRPETVPQIREVDCYWIWSRMLRERLLAGGARRAEYLPFAWDPVVFPSLDLADSPHYDVVFIGNWDRDRERLLERVAGSYDLKIWGSGYWRSRTRSGSPLRACWQGGEATAADAARALIQSRIAINAVRAQNMPDGVVMRTFEAPGAGAFLLSTRTAGATEIFPDGEAGVYFESAEECLAQIQRYLPDDAARTTIAQRAHTIVAASHTYLDRARRMLDVYRELSDSASSPSLT